MITEPKSRFRGFFLPLLISKDEHPQTSTKGALEQFDPKDLRKSNNVVNVTYKTSALAYLNI